MNSGTRWQNVSVPTLTDELSKIGERGLTTVTGNCSQGSTAPAVHQSTRPDPEGSIRVRGVDCAQEPGCDPDAWQRGQFELVHHR